jgi:hypothetical protein
MRGRKKEEKEAYDIAISRQIKRYAFRKVKQHESRLYFTPHRNPFMTNTRGNYFWNQFLINKLKFYYEVEGRSQCLHALNKSRFRNN